MDNIEILKLISEISISSFTGYKYIQRNNQIDYKTSFIKLERSTRISNSFKRKSNYQIEENGNSLKKRKNRK